MKLKTSLVGVKRIQSPVPRSHFAPATIEQAAEAILQVEGLINPLILRRLDWQSYEVVDNHLGYYAAVRAKELDLARGETVQAIILEPEQEAALLAQVQIFRAAPGADQAVSLPVTPSDAPPDFALLERRFMAQFEALHQDNQHLRQEFEQLRRQVMQPQPVALSVEALGAIASQLAPLLIPTTKPQTSTPIASTINLNRATATDLCQLDQLGPKTAQAIIEYRDKNGPFTSINQLTNVPKITPKKLDHWRSSLAV